MKTVKIINNISTVVAIIVIPIVLTFIYSSPSTKTRIVWWFNHPSQKVDWDNLSLIVPRGWNVDIDKSGESMALLKTVGATKELQPEFIRIDFFKLSSSEKKDFVWEEMYKDCQNLGKKDTMNIDNKKVELNTMSGLTNDGKPRIQIIGCIPSEKIKFYANVDKKDSVYQILNTIKW